MRQGMLTPIFPLSLSFQHPSSCHIMLQVAKALSEKGPGQCIAIPANLQKLDEVKRLVEELSKREDRKCYVTNGWMMSNGVSHHASSSM